MKEGRKRGSKVGRKKGRKVRWKKGSNKLKKEQINYHIRENGST